MFNILAVGDIVSECGVDFIRRNLWSIREKYAVDFVAANGENCAKYNGLSPDDFRRRHSFVSFTREDLAETRATIEAFAAVEGLDGHGRAATVRFADACVASQGKRK